MRKDGKQSKYEAAIAADLAARGVPFEYENRRLSYELPRVYIPDFELENGTIIESKGWFSPGDRRKMLEVKRANPHLDIRMLFMKAGTKIGRGTKSATYAEWAEMNGFRWAEGMVPAAWITESVKRSTQCRTFERRRDQEAEGGVEERGAAAAERDPGARLGAHLPADQHQRGRRSDGVGGIGQRQRLPAGVLVRERRAVQHVPARALRPPQPARRRTDAAGLRSPMSARQRMSTIPGHQ